MTALLAQTAATADETLEAATRRLVSDLHTPRPGVFWADLSATAALGWGAFGAAFLSPRWSPAMLSWSLVSALALYRGLCFTHELTHLRRRAVPGFETAWNIVFGVPLLLPSFTYVGVHQSHHSLSTYGTNDDPEYLPFARSRRLIFGFALQSSFVIPALLAVRFLLLAPIGLVWPRFHGWLETYASSFSMNPHYRRVMTPAMRASTMRWELAVLATWGIAGALLYRSGALVHALVLWYAVLAIVSFVNTLRVLGAHDYESDGTPSTRFEQLQDSIDTPGGPWTELWAPVGLRYHALHHFFPGIPYHNLGVAYRRIVAALPPDSRYFQATSPSLRHSLHTLYAAARRRSGAFIGR
jgi:fatty acid desaturase